MRFITYAPTRGARQIGAALAPTMTRAYGSWSSRGRIFGQPGTMGVHAPNPAAIPSKEKTAMASAGGFFASENAPDLIFPAVYYENDRPLNKEKFPGALRSDNQMPVPAQLGRRMYTQGAYKPRLGGQRQVPQPQVVQRWLPMRGLRG